MYTNHVLLWAACTWHNGRIPLPTLWFLWDDVALGWLVFMILNEFVLVLNSSLRIKLRIGTETVEEIKFLNRAAK